jgi:hypothetical protein
LRFEKATVAYIAAAISFHFALPELFVAFNLSFAVNTFWTTVPETSMDKYANLLSRKNYIWFARQVSLVQTISEARIVKKFTNNKLRFSVFASDTSHILTASFPAKAIHKSFGSN